MGTAYSLAGKTAQQTSAVRVVFIVFLVVEVVLVGLTLWDLGRFSAMAGDPLQHPVSNLAALESVRLAGWMLLATLGQLIVATFGFWFVVRTLGANQAAVAVAAHAIEIQEKASADQHRAYVHAAAAEIEWDATRRSCRVQFAFANTGQTPATYFEFGASFVEVPHGTRAREQSIAMPQQFTRWSPIGAGDRVTAAWYEDRLAERLLAYGGSKADGGGVILIMGVVRYGTIFSEIFETEFAFFLRQAPLPDGSPMKLSRSTNAFKAYQRLQNAESA